MVVDTSEFFTFSEWFGGALKQFVVAAIVVLLIGLFVSYLYSLFRHGPVEAFYVVAGAVFGGVVDLWSTSFRRIFAIARLAVQEAIRKRVIVVFAVFVLLLLFGGWFLDVESTHPARLYLSFVLTASSYLVLGLAMFLSAFSLPNDIKARTIYTVVTKPVRAHEIILGRIIGFIFVGTVLLLFMGSVSYFFVVRGLNHGHSIRSEETVLNKKTKIRSGETSFESYHRHEFVVNEAGNGRTNEGRGHSHAVRRTGTDEDARYTLGSAEGELRARVPVYGGLRFMDRNGLNSDRGINVGKEWTYRSYIEGNTLNTAIWTFDGITRDKYPEALPLEMNIRVFRTNKGSIVNKIKGRIVLYNPNPNAPIRRSRPIDFEASEFSIAKLTIRNEDLQYQDRNGEIKSLDLFEDLVHEGRIEVWVRCREHAQFFGMAQADVYLLAADSSFSWNFAKAYLGVWFQMVLVTLFGVLFSSFLSGVVAFKATLATVVLGMFSGFIVGIQAGEYAAAGPIESFIRNLRQEGAVTELAMPEIPKRIVKSLDAAYLNTLTTATHILPRYPEFNTVDKVAYGFNINNSLVARHFLITLAYFFVIAVLGYFIFKTRELAA